MRSRKCIAAVLILCLGVAQLGWLPADALAGSPDDDLKQIQYKQYFRGKYAQAIDSLKTFLARTDLEPRHVAAAREFLAASLVLSGERAQGKDVFLAMLNEDPLYAGPDATRFKPDVLGAWLEARDIYASNRLRNAPAVDVSEQPVTAAATPGDKPIYKKWWFYAGIAAVVLVAGSLANPEEETPAASDAGSVVVGVTVR